MTRQGPVNTHMPFRQFAMKNDNEDEEEKPKGFEKFLKRAKRGMSNKPAEDPVGKDSG